MSTENTPQTVVIDQQKTKELLKDCMMKQGISRAQLAEMVDMTKGYLNSLFSTRDISPEALLRICKALDYPVEDVLSGYRYINKDGILFLRRREEALENRILGLEERVKDLETWIEDHVLIPYGYKPPKKGIKKRAESEKG